MAKTRLEPWLEQTIVYRDLLECPPPPPPNQRLLDIIDIQSAVVLVVAIDLLR